MTVTVPAPGQRAVIHSGRPPAAALAAVTMRPTTVHRTGDLPDPGGPGGGLCGQAEPLSLSLS